MTRKRKDPAAVKLGRKGGKVGGKSTSTAKQKAARANGKKGGRPRKVQPLQVVVCGALPLHGDGTAPCTMPVHHRGFHFGAAGSFSKIEPGSRARAARKDGQ